MVVHEHFLRKEKRVAPRKLIHWTFIRFQQETKAWLLGNSLIGRSWKRIDVGFNVPFWVLAGEAVSVPRGGREGRGGRRRMRSIWFLMWLIRGGKRRIWLLLMHRRWGTRPWLSCICRCVCLSLTMGRGRRRRLGWEGGRKGSE